MAKAICMPIQQMFLSSLIYLKLHAILIALILLSFFLSKKWGIIPHLLGNYSTAGQQFTFLGESTSRSYI
jgi:hypothetical protein